MNHVYTIYISMYCIFVYFAGHGYTGMAGRSIFGRIKAVIRKVCKVTGSEIIPGQDIHVGCFTTTYLQPGTI